MTNPHSDTNLMALGTRPTQPPSVALSYLTTHPRLLAESEGPDAEWDRSGPVRPGFDLAFLGLSFLICAMGKICLSIS